MNRKIRLVLSFLGAPLVVAIALLITIEPSWAAANHYVRSGATGSGSGSDWANACADFTGSCAVASLVRGEVYYVATGTYGSRTFNTAESGTLAITIKGATVADHGTDAGWQPPFGVDVAQAKFSHGSLEWAIGFGTSYWVFDGSVGSGNTASSYGFLIEKPSNCSMDPQGGISVGKVGGTSTGVTVKHIAYLSCGASYDVAQRGIGIGCGACYVTNSTFSNNFYDGLGQSWGITNLSNSTIEHNYSQNQWSSSAHHGETLAVSNCHSSDFAGCSTAFIQGQGSINNTFRHNIIKNCRGTACMAALDPGNAAGMNAWKIYGNVFVDGQGGNGVIATGTMASIYIKDTEIYNNTFVNSSGAIFRQCGSSTPCASTSGNVFKNNIIKGGNGYLAESTGGAIDHDYNSYLSTIQPETETNGQIDTFDPLANSTIGNSGDYHLTTSGASQLRAGLTLPSPYTQDLDGQTRGSDGTWDRGAYEFGGGAPPLERLPPAKPKGLRPQ